MPGGLSFTFQKQNGSKGETEGRYHVSIESERRRSMQPVIVVAAISVVVIIGAIVLKKREK